ncbi:hypothetical protein B0H13DRAFT_1889554 [Mycena leptocephala]|nr:hypothetical protein B0H13DRAFT_1889554 [Mycena leptocephala]
MPPKSALRELFYDNGSSYGNDKSHVKVWCTACIATTIRKLQNEEVVSVANGAPPPPQRTPEQWRDLASLIEARQDARAFEVVSRGAELPYTYATTQCYPRATGCPENHCSPPLCILELVHAAIADSPSNIPAVILSLKFPSSSSQLSPWGLDVTAGRLFTLFSVIPSFTLTLSYIFERVF